ncbi:hypothetical protein [Nitrosococcus wardiae]|uniref:Recombinase domain-containing protein n=1 Tax=Nitrosococcus wardiae TaxID=1814290 RepID=A0A4V1AVS9_9GAMM|nr:hypothetical protein [Nitrosococcus wardiae]QBQ54195.1 hypothetical protein E3U44_06520 [Nitrosococcus wardiae]
MRGKGSDYDLQAWLKLRKDTIARFQRQGYTYEQALDMTTAYLHMHDGAVSIVREGQSPYLTEIPKAKPKPKEKPPTAEEQMDLSSPGPDTEPELDKVSRRRDKHPLKPYQENETRLIQFVINLICQGKDRRHIANILNKCGYRTPAGLRWNADRINWLVSKNGLAPKRPSRLDRYEEEIDPRPWL